MFTYSPFLQKTYTKIFSLPAKFFHEVLRMSPNAVSVLAFVVSMTGLAMIFFAPIGLAIAVMFIGLLLDAVDGSIARIYNLKTKLGAKFELYFDSTHEFLVYPALSLAGYVDWRLTALLVPAFVILRVWEAKNPNIFNPGFKRVSPIVGYILIFNYVAICTIIWVYFGILVQIFREIDQRFIKKSSEAHS